jgi:hypothetical protein
VFRTRSWWVKVPVVVMLVAVCSCFAIVSLGLGAIFLANGNDEAGLADRVEATRTSTVAEARAVAVGTTVELSGTAAANPADPTPLVGPLSGRPVLAFEIVVERYDPGRRSSDGRRSGEGWRDVDSEQASTAFLVDDGTGQIAVTAADADLRAAQHSRQDYSGGLGNEMFERLEAAGVDLPSSARTSERYRVTESAILPGGTVFVLGPVGAADGQPLVGAETGDAELLVSAGTEATFLADARETARNSRLLAYVMFGFGGAMLLVATIVGVIVVRRFKGPTYTPSATIPATPATTGATGTSASSPWGVA